MEFRHFRDEYYEAVCDFLIELNRDGRDHIHWNWARFEWMYGHPGFDISSAGSIGLWFDGGRVVGAAIYDMYFGEAFCAALPGYEALYPGLLDYAFGELKDDAGLGVAVCDSSRQEIAAAERAGFVRSDQTETVLCLDLESLFSAALPEGFSMTEPDPVRDEEALQWLFWQGFDHGDDRAEFEREGRAPSRVRRHLDPHLGLAAVDPAGELAAFVCLWYQSGTGYAYVEPVCTVPGHRKKGLAKALLSETLRRAKALGAGQAYVISDMAFYKNLGFRGFRHYTFYRKK